MIFREAVPADIKQIQRVRNSVRENQLSDPNLVTDADCENYITVRGKGWVCEIDREIIGFAVADLKDNNIWALFIHPLHESKGVGSKLHDMMLDWYFRHSKENVWLSTSPGTRAEKFYRKAGWIQTGLHGKGELKFEMHAGRWKAIKMKRSSSNV